LKVSVPQEELQNEMIRTVESVAAELGFTRDPDAADPGRMRVWTLPSDLGETASHIALIIRRRDNGIQIELSHFLAGPGTRYITGKVLNVDGGLVM